MMDMFRAGGFGMFPILAVGVFALVVGLRATMAPTPKRLALLKTLPGLIALIALFTFGTNMWAINTHLSDPAFAKNFGATEAQLPFIGIIGITEAAQAFTLGGLFAALTAALRAVAEWRNAPSA